MGNLIHGVYHFSQAQANYVYVISLNLLHKLLEHPSLLVLNRFMDVSHSLDVSSDFCNTCSHAKQSRNSFPLSNVVSSVVFDLVHCDVWDPYNKKSTYGPSYFLILVEDHSHTIWVYLLFDKSNVRTNFEYFFKLIQTQFKKTNKSI